MAMGTVQMIVVCAPSAFAQAPCPAGMAVTTLQGYVIDPSQASNIEAQNQPFDYNVAVQIWGMAFTFVVGLFLFSKAVGIILNRIRS